jgi:hypothetical protein
VGLDETARNREPEPGARLTARARAVPPPEAIEHPRRSFRVNPSPVSSTLTSIASGLGWSRTVLRGSYDAPGKLTKPRRTSTSAHGQAPSAARANFTNS